MRQLRGRIIDALCTCGSATLADLAGRCGQPVERVGAAVAALSAEGLIEAALGGEICLMGSGAV